MFLIFMKYVYTVIYACYYISIYIYISKYFKFRSIKIIEKITMKYKIPTVFRSVEMYCDFSTQNLNSAIALLATNG